MTETITPTNADRFSPAYCAANRVVSSDNSIQDGQGTELDWFVLIETEVAGAPEGKACACGCQLAVTNTKRNFLPGHDQRLMGILVRAQREDLEVSWMAGGMLIGAGAMDYARLVLNEKGQAKLAGYLANTPKRARKASRAIETAVAATETEVAVTAPEPTEDDFVLPGEETPIGPMKIDDVKVGRWTYPARRLQDGTVERNEKRDGTGSWVAV